MGRQVSPARRIRFHVPRAEVSEVTVRYWQPRVVPGEPRVGVAIASFLNDCQRRVSALRCLLHSLCAQTYPHWRALVVHDGAVAPGVATPLVDDPRVQLWETPQRKQKFGHPWRQAAMDKLMGDCAWLLLTNDDNYYCPTFFEWLLSEGCKGNVKTQPLLVYCDMVHSHKFWRAMTTAPRYRHLDLGGLLVKSSLAKKVPFDKDTFSGDGDWIDRLSKAAGARVAKVKATLFVHN